MQIEKYTALVYNGNGISGVQDIVSIEVALSISVNGTPFTVTMQTPGRETDLVRGLLFTEGVYREETNPEIVILSKNEEGFINAVDVHVPESSVLRDFAGTRNVISASSCGVCGKTKLDDPVCDAVQNTEVLRPETVERMFVQLNESQYDFKQSGGTHAAGAFTISGDMLCLREDIGRHNAVDKVIGSLLASGASGRAKCLTVSGRISFEIVSKARAAGIPFLAAVSAPSTLAIDYAQESGITLMAFCRDNRFTVYSNPQQLALIGAEAAVGKVKNTSDVKES